MLYALTYIIIFNSVHLRGNTVIPKLEMRETYGDEETYSRLWCLLKPGSPKRKTRFQLGQLTPRLRLFHGALLPWCSTAAHPTTASVIPAVFVKWAVPSCSCQYNRDQQHNAVRNTMLYKSFCPPQSVHKTHKSAC
jgi:hypothetical protein